MNVHHESKGLLERSWSHDLDDRNGSLESSLPIYGIVSSRPVFGLIDTCIRKHRTYKERSQEKTIRVSMRRKAKKERKFSKEKRRRRRSEIEEYAWRDVYEIDNAGVGGIIAKSGYLCGWMHLRAFEQDRRNESGTEHQLKRQTHSRHKTDLNSKGRDNTDNCCSSLSPPRDERKILFLISVN